MIKLPARQRLSQGSHCFSTAITRMVHQHWNDTFDEDLCFGLGCGLGFMYRKERDICCLSGRANDIEKYFATNLAIEYEQYSHDSFSAFAAFAQKELKAGNWILLYLDASKLYYIQLGLSLQDIGMMNEHAGILVGLDEEQELAYLYDYAIRQEVPLTFEQLAKALYNGAKRPQKSDRISYFTNTGLIYRFPSSLMPLNIAVYDAIVINCNNYINPTNKFQGLVGLEYFSRELPILQEWMDQQQFANTLAAFYAYMDKIGTGGGNFRRMYARFLHQAAVILNNPGLDELSKDYFLLSRMWKSFSLSLLELSQQYDAQLFVTQTQAIKEIADLEKETIQKLQHTVES